MDEIFNFSNCDNMEKLRFDFGLINPRQCFKIFYGCFNKYCDLVLPRIYEEEEYEEESESVPNTSNFPSSFSRTESSFRSNINPNTNTNNTANFNGNNNNDNLFDPDRATDPEFLM